jgi:hypothetical protein
MLFEESCGEKSQAEVFNSFDHVMELGGGAIVSGVEI